MDDKTITPQGFFGQWTHKKLEEGQIKRLTLTALHSIAPTPLLSSDLHKTQEWLGAHRSLHAKNSSGKCP